MNNLPLQPIEWREYGNINGTSVDAITPICEYDIYLSNNEPSYIVAYYNRHTEAPTKEATGFATIDEAKAWAWNHYNEKMQPYVKPMPTWIDVNERLPEDDGKYLVATSCGKQWMGNYNLPPKPNEWMLNGWSMNGGWHPFDITHWMPLPKSPSEVEND